MNTWTLTAIVVALGSAVFLYAVGHETRQLETSVKTQEKVADKLRDEIAVLKAERAHLSHPARIEHHALELGLRPVAREQVSRNLTDAKSRLLAPDTQATDR